MIEDSKIKIFITLAQEGSFTKTARLLGLTQPAVSQSITSLEEQLNIKLFNRTRSDILLTSEGEVFLRYANKINYWYQNLNNIFDYKLDNENIQAVTISTNSFVFDYLISKVITSLTSKKINFQLLEEARKQEADVYIKVAPSPKSINFEEEANLIGIIEATVVSSPNNISVKKAAVVEDNPNQYRPFSTIAGIHISNKFVVWEPYLEFLSDDIKCRTLVVSSSVESIKNIVKSSSNLIGILPNKAVENEIFEGSLLKMPIVLTNFTMDLYYVASDNFKNSQLSSLLKQECINLI